MFYSKIDLRVYATTRSFLKYYFSGDLTFLEYTWKHVTLLDFKN